MSDVETINISLRVPYEVGALAAAFKAVDELGETLTKIGTSKFGSVREGDEWPSHWETSVTGIAKTFSVLETILADSIIEKMNQDIS